MGSPHYSQVLAQDAYNGGRSIEGITAQAMYNSIGDQMVRAGTSIMSKNPLDRYSVSPTLDRLSGMYDGKNDLARGGSYNLRNSTDPRLRQLSNGIDLLGALSSLSADYSKK
jgi:hypothetical protein